MNEKMACMCLGCGKTYIIPMPEISIEYLEDLDRKRIKDTCCPECNCELILLGKADEE